ncbi:hypothetical protein PVAG01_04900 [Phlyctema vagabunda]|uniref:Uncharacterized protein n=1 Tax=Phlyctema vagabunda TaxID=108571 RepID=A0ABR4PIK4_9HELO
MSSPNNQNPSSDEERPSTPPPDVDEILVSSLSCRLVLAMKQELDTTREKLQVATSSNRDQAATFAELQTRASQSEAREVTLLKKAQERDKRIKELEAKVEEQKLNLTHFSEDARVCARLLRAELEAREPNQRPGESTLEYRKRASKIWWSDKNLELGAFVFAVAAFIVAVIGVLK